MKNYLQIFTASVVGATLTIGAFQFMERSPEKVVVIEEPAHMPVNRVSFPAETQADFISAADKSIAAVVHVKTTQNRDQPGFHSLNDLFFGRPSSPKQYQVQGSGSGVILKEDGYIVTNNHVIAGATDITIITNSNDSYKATLVGSDPTTDIALLKIDAEGLPHLEVANSDDVKLGQWVLAVGNPFNLTGTVTAGIVSAKGRDINIINEHSAIESFIQTDAAVNPGNSGGALVNTDGALVGINTAISSRSGSFEGYSFAVPSNLVLKVVRDLETYGRVQRAFLGINYRDLSPAISAELELSVNSGVYVAGLLPGGGAESSGISVGDIILRIGDKPVATGADLTEAIGQHSPGDDVTVIVNRDGENKKFNVTLRNANNTTSIMPLESGLNNMLGAALHNLTEQEHRAFNTKYGVKVGELSTGRLQRADVEEGFIIIKINNVYIQSTQHLESLLKQFRPGDGVLIQGLNANGRPQYRAFEW